MNAKPAPPYESTIRFRDVTYSLIGSTLGSPRTALPRGSVRTIVSGISLEIHHGETLVLLGRSGSGKTTLLRLINRLLQPTSGQVFVQGRSTAEWDLIRLRRGIGYVIQEAGLFPHFTVAQNISLVPTLEKWDSVRVAARVDELLALVGLDAREFANRRPHELS